MLGRAGGLLLALLGLAGLALATTGAAAPVAESAAGPASPAVAAATRLRLIVTPARVLPGRSSHISVSDTTRAGAISGTVCATSPGRAQRCRNVRLPAGQRRLRLHIPLASSGRWRLTLRQASGAQVARRAVDVRQDARARVLLTGDSFVYGISDVLTRFLKAHRGSLLADPNPGSGITKPAVLDWAAHARLSANGDKPDVTIVFLGVADGFPLVIAGQPVACCGPAWGDEYVRRVDRMMTAYLRDGRGLVYWALLPTPRDPAMAEIFSAVNSALRRAAAARRDGVRLIDVPALISPGGRFQETITYRGKRELVRAPDGFHLAREGVHIVAALLARTLRKDGIVR